MTKILAEGKEFSIQYLLFITKAYVIFHAITAFIVTPIQNVFLSEITVFASLVYLPHGVRVLATWLWGWKAFFPLYAGNLVSALIFNSSHAREVLDTAVIFSTAMGSLSALLAFELMRLLGRNLYAGQSRKINWRWLLLVGAFSSVINSIGQSLIHSGSILPEQAMSVLVTFAVGDLVGLFVSMVALMVIFRWIRLINEPR